MGSLLKAKRQSSRLRKPLNNLLRDTPTQQASYFSKLLVNLNHLSQIGLFLLAIFGYFYTVKPLYSKALLEEQIAQKEFELKKIGTVIGSMKIELHNKQDELETAKQMADKEVEQLSIATSRLDLARKEIKAKENDLSNAKGQLQETYNNIKPALLKAFKEELTLCSWKMLNRGGFGYEPNFAKIVGLCIKDKADNSIYLKQLKESDKQIIESKVGNAIAAFEKQGTDLVLAENKSQHDLDEWIEKLSQPQKQFTPDIDAIQQQKLNELFETSTKLTKLLQDEISKISYE